MFFLNYPISKASESCVQYLDKTLFDASPYDYVFEGLPEALEDYRGEQQNRINAIYSKLKQQTQGIPGSNHKPIPPIEQHTLDYMLSWAKLESRVRLDVLRSTLATDPFFVYLRSNWAQVNPSILEKYKGLDFSGFSTKDGHGAPKIKSWPETFKDHFMVHLLYDGPMYLRPELLVLRMIRDHDLRFSEEFRSEINSILNIERRIYVLNRYIQELKSKSNDQIKYWKKFKTSHQAYAEMQSLKELIRNTQGVIDERRFLREQLETQTVDSSGDLVIAGPTIDPESSYEDYLAHQLLDSANSEYVANATDYFELKELILLYEASKSFESLDELLISVIASEIGYFLY